MSKRKKSDRSEIIPLSDKVTYGYFMLCYGNFCFTFQSVMHCEGMSEAEKMRLLHLSRAYIQHITDETDLPKDKKHDLLYAASAKAANTLEKVKGDELMVLLAKLNVKDGDNE